MVVILLLASNSNRWLSASGVPIESNRREPLPDFDFPQLNGGHWRLRDHRGDIVLLDFWATWCPPCREETPGLVHLSQHLPSNDIVVVGISMDENQSAITAFVRAFHVPYPVLLPPSGSALPGSVESLPTSLLLDRQSRVAHSYVGAVSEAVFSRDIEQLRGESRLASVASTNR